MSTEESDESIWNSLQPTPSNACKIDILSLNPNELLVIPSSTILHPDSLWKYNINNNNWIKWWDYPKDMTCEYHTAALNKNKTILYIFGDPGNVIKVDLKTGQFNISENEYYDGAHSRSLYINDLYHTFGGWGEINKCHFVYDDELKTLTEVHKFVEMDDVSSLNLHSVMYISSKKSVLIIPNSGKSIYLYSMITMECIKVYFDGSESPDFMNYFLKALITKNEEFVICFMGTNPKSISIFNLKTMKITKSNVKCPKCFDGVCIRNDIYKQEMVTFGFVRSCWNLPQFSCIRYPSMEIIKIIESFNNFEVVHVINYMNDTDGSHFSISVDQIIAPSNTIYSDNISCFDVIQNEKAT